MWYSVGYLTLLMIYINPLTPPPPVSSSANMFLIFHLNATTPPLNSLYINNQQPQPLLCANITPPEDELQHQLRKFVIKSPCPEEAFYLQILRILHDIDNLRSII